MISTQPDPLIGIGMTLAVVLAAVFAIAGAVKLTSPSKTTVELAGLGVPLPGLVARTLPPAELALAGLLLVAPSWGGLVATGALLVFTSFVLRAVRSGSTVFCGCLGSLSGAPVSSSTVVRNGALLLMAIAAMAVPGPVIPDLASVLAALSLVLLASVAAQLIALHDRIGRLWSVALAGEEATDGSHPRGEPVQASHTTQPAKRRGRRT